MEKNTITLPEYCAASLTNFTVTVDEVQRLAAMLKTSPLDLARMSTPEEEDFFAGLLRQFCAAHTLNAIARTRRLEARDRGFWLATIATVEPRLKWILKDTPDWDDDALWYVTFFVIYKDEVRLADKREQKAMLKKAVAEQSGRDF